MSKISYDTVTEAMADLKKRGYSVDFSIISEKECVVCNETKTELSPDNFKIDEFHRFEGNSDPGDGMVVYAISSKNNEMKGVLVNAYGIYANNTSSALIKKLNTHPK